MPDRPVVVAHIDRSDAAAIEELQDAGAATVHEAIGRRGYLGADLRPIQQDVAMAGNAVTVLSHPGDNLMLHAAVEVCQEGDVLVVATTAPSTHGMFGELIATSLRARGVRGLVMGAAIRDSAELREMGFPVWTRHISCQGTVKATPGSVNVPIAIGDTIVTPGDLIVADDDGVVAVPHAEVAWCQERVAARLAREAAKRERLRAGELAIDIDGLRDQLANLGVAYVERLEDRAGD